MIPFIIGFIIGQIIYWCFVDKPFRAWLERRWS